MCHSSHVILLMIYFSNVDIYFHEFLDYVYKLEINIEKLCFSLINFVQKKKKNQMILHNFHCEIATAHIWHTVHFYLKALVLIKVQLAIYKMLCYYNEYLKVDNKFHFLFYLDQEFAYFFI